MSRAAKKPDEVNLTPAMTHILIALLEGERHGYAIMQAIDEITAGEMRIGPGTLYTSIRKLLDAGLISESGERPDSMDDDERRRYYRLSAEGRRAAGQEVARLSRLVRFAKRYTFSTHAIEA
jgi:DNA-binding PadR family transcriptional regulator